MLADDANTDIVNVLGGGEGARGILCPIGRCPARVVDDVAVDLDDSIAFTRVAAAVQIDKTSEDGSCPFVDNRPAYASL